MNIFRRFLPNACVLDADASRLLPVLLPVSTRLPDDANPPLPMGGTGFGLTACVCAASALPQYLTVEQAGRMAETGTAWHTLAMQNMVRCDKGFPFSQERRRDDGRFIWLTARHDDGLGTSRLLLHDVLAARFPGGYRIALPDRGVGFALAGDLREAEEQEVTGQIRLCFERAILPGSPRLFAPELFSLPASVAL